MDKIYLLLHIDYKYAQPAHVGTWAETGEFCKNCEAPATKLVDPLLIEWDLGSDIIGDFSWCGYTIIVQDEVKKFFVSEGFDCDFSRVTVQKNTITKRKTNIVPFPYNGPNLNWLKPKHKINLDIEKTGLEIAVNCTVCNYKKFKFKMNGIVIPREEINGINIFKINQFGLSAATYVTEDALQKILSMNFTNFGYREAGYIV